LPDRSFIVLRYFGTAQKFSLHLVACTPPRLSAFISFLSAFSFRRLDFQHTFTHSLANLRHSIDSIENEDWRTLVRRTSSIFTSSLADISGSGSGLIGTPLYTLHSPFPIFCFKVEIFTSAPQFDNSAGLEWLAWFAWNLWERMDLVSLIGGSEWVDVEDGWDLGDFFSFELHGGEIDDLIWFDRQRAPECTEAAER
jgi:hypothetical protein